MSNTINLYTDGSCLHNPGQGGWAFNLWNHDTLMHEEGGSHHKTTNNIMEMTAVAQGLRYIHDQNLLSCAVYTDSQYVKNGITLWITKWRQNGWKTASNKPVKNRQLWQQIAELSQNKDITWTWVKAHAHNTYNNRVDKQARTYALRATVSSS